jgi:hypothetical protein
MSFRKFFEIFSADGQTRTVVIKSAGASKRSSAGKQSDSTREWALSLLDDGSADNKENHSYLQLNVHVI